MSISSPIGVVAGCLRSARLNPPADRAALSMGYCSAEVITATEAWFLAAARTMVGPPMSICSTHSSSEAPEATVAANG